MAASRKNTERPRKSAPAKTPEARENQLIALAVDLAERQLQDGSASAQVITHYLKLASTRERLEKEKLSKENKLLEAKTDAIKSQKKIEDLYANALKAMSAYNGRGEEGNEGNDFDA
jgi:hypothetical protein